MIFAAKFATLRGMKKFLIYLVGSLITLSGVWGPGIYAGAASATADCPDVKIIFARGSGGARWTDQNFVAWKAALEPKLALTDLTYEFVDLDYTAIGIGNLKTMLGAYVGAGEAYEFGESVMDGVEKLVYEVNETCPGTKFVVGGYSQGAIVVSRAVHDLNADKMIYAATFGDPKLYLPEGAGAQPAACSGRNLSNYRIYVPDCQAYEGLLKGYNPYQPLDFVDKMGTWCNKFDIFCSSHFNISDHVGYVADDLYEDAAKLIFDKITKAFGIENTFVSAHDTVILVDLTGSMMRDFAQYKATAREVGMSTLKDGGRVALYGYATKYDDVTLMPICDFDSCKLENFTTAVEGLQIVDGSPAERAEDGSFLYINAAMMAAYDAMTRVDWQNGATKSFVLLSNTNFARTEFEREVLADVVELSKTIDPVNFYVVSTEEVLVAAEDLILGTDGAGFLFDDTGALPDLIAARFDALSRVEETAVFDAAPALKILEFEDFGAEVSVRFSHDGEMALVILNDAVLGLTTEDALTIGELYRGAENVLRLTPIKNNRRGEATEVVIGATTLIPKAPNTGQL